MNRIAVEFCGASSVSLLSVQDSSGVSPPVNVMVTRGLIMVFGSERIRKLVCDPYEGLGQRYQYRRVDEIDERTAEWVN